jgi:protein gp37
MKELIIDPEFKSALPPLSKEEYDLLESQIVQDGCRESLITWNNILIDGHNRYEICNKHGFSFETNEMFFDSREDVLIWIYQNQIGKRNLTDYSRVEVALKLKSVISDRAKKNQGTRTDISSNLTESIDTRKEVADLAGVSTGNVSKVEYIQSHAPEAAKEQLRIGNVSINKVFEETKAEEKRLEPEKKSLFNDSNDNIEWARWSWNPVTGCKHGCEYCYAEDIANRFFAEKFEPTFRPERLNAPQVNKVPESAKEKLGHKNVFVCSMADLFGDWVPKEWIDAVIKSVKDAPQWNFLFLTKNPKRLLEFDFPINAWVGTTVDKQFRVKEAEEIFSQLTATVKFLSCEPLLEPLEFSNLNAFDWIIIGASSGNSRTPVFKPKWDWVESILFQARGAGIKVYFKPNLFRHTKTEIGIPGYRDYKNDLLPSEAMRPREYPEV